MIENVRICQCGCGQVTKIAKKTRSAVGHIKGEPIPYINGHNQKKAERYRIEDRGYDTPCHTWLLAVNRWGYGVESVGRRSCMAHVVAYERCVGQIPDGLHLDHLCRNRNCVNPAHLEPVTPAVNVRRGKQTRLTYDQVVIIKRLLERGDAQKDIASLFNVHHGTISAIKCGVSWKEVTA